METIKFLVKVWGADGNKPANYAEPDEMRCFDTFEEMEQYLNSEDAQQHWDNEVCWNNAADKWMRAGQPTKKFKVFQISDSAKNARNYTFTGLDMLQHLNLKVERANYKQVYDGEIAVLCNDTNAVLETIYAKLQGSKPEGYTGHSLSVSDLVLMDGKYYFCDDFGFAQINFNRYGQYNPATRREF